MSKENLFVPLPEAQTSRLRTNVNLPLGIERSIGINTRNTHLLLQLGGIRHLLIKSQEGQTSQSVPQIVGISSQGIALAGRAALNTIPTHRETFQTDRMPIHQACWVDLDISLNTSEMQQRVLEAKRSIREASVWAREINQAVTWAIVCAGTSHLLKDIKILDVFNMVAYYPQQIFWADRTILSFEQVSPTILAYLNVAISLAIGCSVWNIFQSIFYGKEQSGSGNRISLFPAGPEFDRALLLLLLGKTRTLVKELKKDTIQEQPQQR